MPVSLPAIVHIALILMIIGMVLALINRSRPVAGSIESILDALVVILHLGLAPHSTWIAQRRSEFCHDSKPIVGLHSEPHSTFRLAARRT
jgi:hypothetical protein